MSANDLPPLALESEPLAINRIAGIENDLRAWASKAVDFSFNPAGTDLFSIHELAHSYARRAIDLAESIRLLLKEQRIVPATILGRALIETVATGCFFMHEINRLVATGDRQRVDKSVRRFYAGVKGAEVEPMHIMDAMRHLDKIDADYVTYLDQKYGLLTIAAQFAQPGQKATPEDIRLALSAMRNYDLLSEVAHPNGTGTQFLYPDTGEPWPEADKLRHRFRQASLMAIWSGQHLLKALAGLESLQESYRRAFLPNESSRGP
jgi:hypothetical protein